MNKMLLVTIVDGFCNLFGPFPCYALLEGSMFCQAVKELAVRTDFHDHVDFVLRNDHFIQLRHMRVYQVAPRFDFANQGRMVNAVHNLDGNGKSRQSMNGLLHLSETALANGCTQRIVANRSHLARLDFTNDIIVVFLLSLRQCMWYKAT